MPRKHKLSGAQERQRRKAREQERVRAEAAAVGLKIATPAPGEPVEDALRTRRQALGEVPKTPQELGVAVAFHLAALAREAELDETLPPERSREQAARLWSLCGKNVALAREVDELAELEQELEKLRSEVSVGHVEKRAERTVSMREGAQ